MATHAIGKLKFNLSEKGLAYRWGDGEVHRLFGGKKQPGGEEEYVEKTDGELEEDYAGDGQSYARDDRDYDDDYADEDYADDDYADDGSYYDDEGDRGYDEGEGDEDDRYYDDDYDDRGYDGGEDDGYDEGGDDYDDRYSDEDAEDSGEAYDEQNALLRYVDENDWVTYLLLFLFPPLGIYLLWRRNRFDRPVRIAITAASAIWFVVALILLLRLLAGGPADRQTQSIEPIPSLKPVEETQAPPEDVIVIDDTTQAPSDNAEDNGGSTDSGDQQDAALPEDFNIENEPSPTPRTSSPGSSGAAIDDSAYVYSPATGLYYHSKTDCENIEEGVSVSHVPKEIAVNSRRQSPCPVCIGGGTTQTYYATRGGKYYHLDSTCSKMQNPETYTKEAAENAGKKPCPVCVTKEKKSLDEPDEDSNVVFISSNTTDKSGIQVYATKGGKNFHVKSDCRGMTGASKMSLRDALLAGKTACSTCCPTAGTMVYTRADSKSYHIDAECQGMKNAKKVSLAEAMVMGKTKCDVCIKGSITDVAREQEKEAEEKEKEKEEEAREEQAGPVGLTSPSSGEVKVYGTKNGKYYHTDATCSGMKDAQSYTLKSMLLAGRDPCPKCASNADTTVYATQKGKYYHSYATCSGISNANSGTLAEALAAGYKRCPKCWGSNNKPVEPPEDEKAKEDKSEKDQSGEAKDDSAAEDAGKDEAEAGKSTATAKNTYVYATRSGKYYHLDHNCGGMTDASRVSLKTAIDAGKTPCPVCATAANRVVYSTKNGKYYHADSTCEASGLKNGSKRTLAEALMMNQTACPYCLGKNAAAKGADVVPVKMGTTYRSGKSGIRVYATQSGKYYHTDSTCGGMTNASRVTLETALNYGKRACPVCAKTAERTVYATKGGKYYHYSKSCAGDSASRGSLASALAYGYDPCPNCVRHVVETEDLPYKSGTSGIKVYATAGSKYFHSRPDCSGMTNASRVTLETALNYGKTACPVCLSAANRKVYAAPGGKYYHYSKAHAGSGATAGTLAEARAYGLKACPTCTVSSPGSQSPDNGGAEDAPISTVNYPAEADTAVYIKIGSANNYYHMAAKCKEANFSNGSKVTLQYALDWGYKACPYCNPPTMVLPGSDGGD